MLTQPRKYIQWKHDQSRAYHKSRGNGPQKRREVTKNQPLRTRQDTCVMRRPPLPCLTLILPLTENMTGI